MGRCTQLQLRMFAYLRRERETTKKCLSFAAVPRSGSSTAITIALIDTVVGLDDEDRWIKTDGGRIDRSDHKIQGLVVCPTHEAAIVIFDMIQKYSNNSNIVPALIIGGNTSTKESNLTNLRGKPDIVVCTEGRFLDVFNDKNIDLSALKLLVFEITENEYYHFFMAISPPSNCKIVFIGSNKWTLKSNKKLMKNPKRIRSLKHMCKRNNRKIHANCIANSNHRMGGNIIRSEQKSEASSDDSDDDVINGMQTIRFPDVTLDIEGEIKESDDGEERAPSRYHTNSYRAKLPRLAKGKINHWCISMPMNSRDKYRKRKVDICTEICRKNDHKMIHIFGLSVDDISYISYELGRQMPEREIIKFSAKLLNQFQRGSAIERANSVPNAIIISTAVLERHIIFEQCRIVIVFDLRMKTRVFCKKDDDMQSYINCESRLWHNTCETDMYAFMLCQKSKDKRLEFRGHCQPSIDEQLLRRIRRSYGLKINEYSA